MPATSVTIRLSPDCWQFLIRAELPNLHPGTQVSLKGAIEVPVEQPILHRQYVFGLLLAEAVQLADRLAARHAAMAPHDPKYSLCERCLVAVKDAIRLSQTP
jgi:hypothetical protein